MTVELSERAAPEGAKALLAADRAGNFWPLTVLSFGERHNSHHADPTCARHGVLPGQVDPSARLTWLLEKFGWVFDVRWPKPQRFAGAAHVMTERTRSWPTTWN